jgi:hypothetical protein
MADESRVSSLLLTGKIKAHAELAAQYDRNPIVRTIVRRIVHEGSDRSRLTGAYCVASRACDETLWQIVADRAALGASPVEEYTLREWPDMRGIEYFSGAFVHDDGSVRWKLHLYQALMFFIHCCVDQGIAFLTATLGHPFLTEAESEFLRVGRLHVGQHLADAAQLYDLNVNRDWLEYVAAALLADRIPVAAYATGTPTMALLTTAKGRTKERFEELERLVLEAQSQLRAAINADA